LVDPLSCTVTSQEGRFQSDGILSQVFVAQVFTHRPVSVYFDSVFKESQSELEFESYILISSLVWRVVLRMFAVFFHDYKHFSGTIPRDFTSNVVVHSWYCEDNHWSVRSPIFKTRRHCFGQR